MFIRCEKRARVVKLYPGYIVKRVEGGYMVFRTEDDYRVWCGQV